MMPGVPVFSMPLTSTMPVFSLNPTNSRRCLVKMKKMSNTPMSNSGNTNHSPQAQRHVSLIHHRRRPSTPWRIYRDSVLPPSENLLILL